MRDLPLPSYIGWPTRGRSQQHTPHLVNEEFEAYLNYRRLEYEILRVKCDACRHEKEVARLMVSVGAMPACYPPSRP